MPKPAITNYDLTAFLVTQEAPADSCPSGLESLDNIFWFVATLPYSILPETGDALPLTCMRQFSQHYCQAG